MFDTIIRQGKIYDGLGGQPFIGDIAFQDGIIQAIGPAVAGTARHEIDAQGAIVTPGWIDVHTHYDGQVSWDTELAPSSHNGTTTVVMGNCGVGFAPVKKGQEQALIELMEGVEDIPGTALYEGIEWGRWESFPEYLDYIASREYAIDVGARASLIAPPVVSNDLTTDKGSRMVELQGLPHSTDGALTVGKEPLDAGRSGGTNLAIFSTSISGRIASPSPQGDLY